MDFTGVSFQPDPNNPSQSNATASPGAAAIGSLGKKLGGLKTTFSNMKSPFNKQTSHPPPKPPSKDFLTTNHQPSTSEDNLNRPYEDETISRGATNNHVAVSGRHFLCCIICTVHLYWSDFLAKAKIFFDPCLYSI